MAATMDDALDILHRTGPKFGGGLANHGPMAAEAMLALGRPDAVLPWVERYKSRLQDRPAPSQPIATEAWREALGQINRVSDWVAFFDHQLAEAPWQDVVRSWVPRLSPALIAAATHGLIRTSHAVRSLGANETPQRLHELAEGLGFWAARYRVLPGTPAGGAAGDTPGEALARVPRVHEASFEARGLIGQQLQGLDDHPWFAEVIDLVSTEGALSEFLSRLTELCAGIYLVNQHNLVAFIHTVTAPSALRLLVPYLAEADARLAARYAWQACAALYAWYSTEPPPATEGHTPPSEDLDTLIDRAVAAGDAHTIKLTEACLREYACIPRQSTWWRPATSWSVLGGAF
jgi:questin oxidase-like protein